MSWKALIMQKHLFKNQLITTTINSRSVTSASDVVMLALKYQKCFLNKSKEMHFSPESLFAYLISI